MEKPENSLDNVIEELEMQVNHLLEASSLDVRKQYFSGALEKAKEANRYNKDLCRHREKHGLIDQVRDQQ